MVSKKDREDFKAGQHDSKADSVTQAIWSLTTITPKSDAYYKGLRGEQLDGDKKK